MTSFVYFVQAGVDGPIKIGSTKDIKKRILSLRTGCPYKLEILGVIRWSNMNCGPMTTHPNGGAHLIGDGLFVLPIDHYSTL